MMDEAKAGYEEMKKPLTIIRMLQVKTNKMTTIEDEI